MRASERAERVDRDLVEQAQRGDREAFAVLARTRGDKLFGIARRILRDVSLAEDAVQQALVIAWRELPRLRVRTGSTPGSSGRSSTPATPRRAASAHGSPPSRCYRSTDRRARMSSRRSPIATRSSEGSGGCRPSSGRSSPCITTWASIRTRSARCSRSPPGLLGRGSITPTGRCVPCWRPMPGRRLRQGAGSDDQSNRCRADPRCLPGPRGGPAGRPRHRRRTHRHRPDPTATRRVRRAVEDPNDEQLRPAGDGGGRRRGRRHRRSRPAPTGPNVRTGRCAERHPVPHTFLVSRAISAPCGVTIPDQHDGLGPVHVGSLRLHGLVPADPYRVATIHRERHDVRRPGRT
jgi:Sigma-70 region 2